jgi:hypothetical protein
MHVAFFFTTTRRCAGLVFFPLYYLKRHTQCLNADSNRC